MKKNIYLFTFILFFLFSKVHCASYIASVASIPDFTITGSSGTCGPYVVKISSISLDVYSKNGIQLKFNYNVGGTTGSYSDFVSYTNNLNSTFPALTFTCPSPNSTKTFAINPILSNSTNIGFSTISAALRFSCTGSLTGSSITTNTTFSYTNVIQPTGTFASINAGDIVNGGICTTSQFSVDIDGDHFGSVYIEIDDNRYGDIVSSQNNFNINTVFLRNSFAGLNLGSDNTTHRIKLVLLNSNNTLYRKVDINTTIKTFTPYSNVTISSNPANGVSCYGTPITFSTNITGAGYKWSDGSNAGQSYTVNNPVNGFGYSVIVTNNGVCPVSSNTITANVINFTPSINPSKTQACDGETVTLSAQPNNTNAYDYKWTSGSTSVSTSNTLLVNSSGSWGLSITPKIGSCSTKTVSPVNINFIKTVSGQKITLPANKERAIFCANESSMVLTASADDLNGVTYQWSGAASGTSSALPITQGGTYSLVLSKGGCSTPPVSLTVIGNTKPIINPNPIDARECNGKAVVLNSTTIDKTNFTYEWYNGANLLSSQFEPTLNTTTSGTYRLVLKPIGAGCTQFNETTQSVTIDPNINGKVSPSGNAVICNTAVGLNLSASGDGTGISFVWNTGANTSVINVKTEGTFTVNMTRGKCNESKSVTTTIQNLTAELKDKNGNKNNIIVCNGSNYLDYPLIASSNFTNAVFKWKHNNDNTDAPNSTNSNSYSPRAAGEYYVFAEVPSLGCTAPSSSNKITVVIPPNFSVDITPSNSSPICDGNDQTFTAASNYSTSPVLYEWSGNGKSGNNNTFTTKDEGQYSVRISREGCQASSTVSLTTKPSKPTITVVDEVFLKSSVSSDNLYAWYYKKTAAETFNTSGPSEGSGQDFIVSNPLKTGFYSVLANREGCGRKLSEPVEVKFYLTSIGSSSSNSAFKVYPNPILQNITIDDDHSLNKKIELFDVYGKLIETWYSSESKLNLNIDDLSGGVYHLIIQSNDKKTIKKLYKL